MRALSDLESTGLIKVKSRHRGPKNCLSWMGNFAGLGGEIDKM